MQRDFESDKLEFKSNSPASWLTDLGQILAGLRIFFSSVTGSWSSLPHKLKGDFSVSARPWQGIQPPWGENAITLQGILGILSSLSPTTWSRGPQSVTYHPPATC